MNAKRISLLLSALIVLAFVARCSVIFRNYTFRVRGKEQSQFKKLRLPRGREREHDAIFSENARAYLTYSSPYLKESVSYGPACLPVIPGSITDDDSKPEKTILLYMWVSASAREIDFPEQGSHLTIKKTLNRAYEGRRCPLKIKRTTNYDYINEPKFRRFWDEKKREYRQRIEYLPNGREIIFSRLYELECEIPPNQVQAFEVYLPPLTVQGVRIDFPPYVARADTYLKWEM